MLYQSACRPSKARYCNSVCGQHPLHSSPTPATAAATATATSVPSLALPAPAGMLAATSASSGHCSPAECGWTGVERRGSGAEGVWRRRRCNIDGISCCHARCIQPKSLQAPDAASSHAARPRLCVQGGAHRGWCGQQKVLVPQQTPGSSPSSSPRQRS